jgi:hypothetical protein
MGFVIQLTAGKVVDTASVSGCRGVVASVSMIDALSV